MTHVTFLFPRRVNSEVAIQRYFAWGLSERANVRISNEPLYSRVARRVHRKFDLFFKFAAACEKSRLPLLRRAPESGAAGRYVAELDDGQRLKFVIDCADPPRIYRADFLEWSDVYFKANGWPDHDYDPRVRPIINGNGNLDPERVEHLRSLRGREKDIDVSFIVNVWGGREHNVRLFEALAQLEAKTELLAIFPPGFDDAETREFERRLERAGVRWSHEQIPIMQLWDVLSRSHAVFFRSGKHLCLPLRTLDVLAMGACLVVDADPLPEWYVPLRDGVNFVSCGVRRGVDTSPGPQEDYKRISALMRGLLDDPTRMQSIRDANARYFDEVAAPERVAEYILRTLYESTSFSTST